VADEPLRHGDLCFGCGQANLFGLQLELSRSEAGVEGRFFVKQDHQGPSGTAHAGVLAAALWDALSAAGSPPVDFTVSLLAPAPVGAYVHVRASGTSATASNEDGVVLARASAAGAAGA
jgi:acyl-coenzyme A thioesterase PaaI-like protein